MPEDLSQLAGSPTPPRTSLGAHSLARPGLERQPCRTAVSTARHDATGPERLGSTGQGHLAAAGQGRPSPGTHAAAGARWLEGVRVLLGRERAHDPLATVLEADGAAVTRCALTVTVPGDAAALASARAALLASRYDWLVATSARTLRYLDVTGLPAGVRTAAVGPATASALERATGRAPDVTGTADAEALLSLLTPPAPRSVQRTSQTPLVQDGEAARRSGRAGSQGHQAPGGASDSANAPATPSAPATPNRRMTAAVRPAHACVQPGESVLLPASAIARPVLAEGLAALGAQVTRLDAYSTLPAAPDTVPPEIRRDWAEGRYDVVLLTASSGVRAAAELLGTLPDGCGVVVLGEPSARAVRETGLLADPARLAIAPSPDADGVTAAVRTLLAAQDGPTSSNDRSAPAHPPAHPPSAPTVAHPVGPARANARPTPAVPPAQVPERAEAGDGVGT